MNNIYQAMAEVMKDIDAVGKNQKNQQQGFKFRGIDDVYNAVHPILAKHGVFTVPTVLNERTEERQTRNGGNLIYRILTMKYTFFASDGSSVEAVVIGEGMDSGDKGANKGMAIAHKYALLQTLCIPTEDMIDPDSEVQDPSFKKPEGRPEPKKRPEPPRNPERKPYDPVKATLKGSTLIPVGMFSVKRAWSQILELCSGDAEFAKGMFAQFGADSSDKITYEIYREVLNAIKNPAGGPESFEGSEHDDVPFERNEYIA